jgi:hypothetical protein
MIIHYPSREATSGQAIVGSHERCRSHSPQ